MSRALAGKADAEDSQRALVTRVLERTHVREMAARMGLSVEQAKSVLLILIIVILLVS